MSGHSKWSTIKHRKGNRDMKRSKLFSKVVREINVAAKAGGENVNDNFRLKTAIAWAKSVNMPGSNIQNAIKRGAGDKSRNYETVFYEGFAAAGIPVIVECLTDNRNRTASSMRTLFTKHGANLGSLNSVRHMFRQVGIFKIPASFQSEEEILETLMDSDAEDVNSEGDCHVVTTAAKNFGKMQSLFESKNIPLDFSELALEAENPIRVDDAGEALKILNFFDALEDDEDVQKIHSGLEFSAGVQEEIVS